MTLRIGVCGCPDHSEDAAQVAGLERRGQVRRPDMVNKQVVD
jgi:hypothetical protein